MPKAGGAKKSSGVSSNVGKRIGTVMIKSQDQLDRMNIIALNEESIRTSAYINENERAMGIVASDKSMSSSTKNDILNQLHDNNKALREYKDLINKTIRE